MASLMESSPSFSPSFWMNSVNFLSLSSEEVKRLSVKRITNPLTFDDLLHPNNGGLYDQALGPTDPHELCVTCGLNYIHCPGHFAHISLPLPVFHPIFFFDFYQILQSSCLSCHRLCATPIKLSVFKGQMKLLDFGLVSEALELESFNSKLSASPSPAESEQTLTQIVQGHIAAAGEGRASDNDHAHLNHGGKSRNLTEVKRRILASFFKSVSKTKCPHCDAPVRKIRQEYQTKVMLRGMSDKLAGQWVAAATRERQRAGERREERGKSLFAGRSYTSKFCSEQQFFSPLEAREHIQLVYDNDPLLMKALFACLKIGGENPFEGGGGGGGGREVEDIFFLETLLVCPSRFRPMTTMGSKKFENDQTKVLQKILQDTIDIEELTAEKRRTANQDGDQTILEEESNTRPKKSLVERLQSCWTSLQTNVNSYMDSDINKRLRDVPSGIKQTLEKKEGLFRKHMMGKRVNYAARSVISPDPNINMDEIGIPMVFATRLTYPEPVTFWNWSELSQAVINGPHVHPGATHVQNEDGSLILLRNNERQRRALAKSLLSNEKLNLDKVPKKVYRHLKNGDILLLNRQPSLHKPSIMAHKARVLPGEKTLRLHYANCKTYNADFDGDEMNAHFPQGELARSEAYGIVSTQNQYLVPKDGTPLSGLIQDHVVSGVILTLRDRFFEKGDYQNLLIVAMPDFTSPFKLLPPTILKPQELWTGKQVISSLLLNLIPAGQDKLNLCSKTKISPKEWGRYCKKSGKKSKYNDDIMTESEVIFREGQLLSGVIDKSQFGASQFGFVHSCYELYGGQMCNNLLSALGRVFTGFLKLYHGFSLGVEDILVKPEANKERLGIITEGRTCGLEAAADAFVVKNVKDKDLIVEKYTDVHHTIGRDGLKVLDFFMKKKTDQINNKINVACIPVGLHKPFPSNSLQLMVQAGAKGSTVNCMQISCLLGQIELEGRRPPIMLSGRSLPTFLPYDTTPRSGGFVDGRFLTGVRPPEFFLHAMAGREGLVDTAVKTSRSGYLQRCLIKHLEGITVNYDLTVRDSDGSILQFLYGEDGLDISKTQFLSPKQMSFLEDNYKAFLYRLDPSSAVSVLEAKKAAKYQRKVDRWKKKQKQRSVIPRVRRSGFLDYCDQHLPEIKAKYSDTGYSTGYRNRTKAQQSVIDQWYSSSPMLRQEFNDKHDTVYLPTTAVLRPDRYFGSVPEKLISDIEQYISTSSSFRNKQTLMTADKFRTLSQFKCLRAIAEPGEPVGLLAAQSIGEPSTQMTLNTFHFAGRGEMNVTLGIPRLREILMTGSPNIKTPAMDVPLLSLPDAKEKGDNLKKYFSRVLLKDVLDSVEVWEKLDRKGEGFYHRSYTIKLTFLEPKYYKDEYIVNPSKILKFVETSFIKKLSLAVSKEIKKSRDKLLKDPGTYSDKSNEYSVPESEDKDEDAAGPSPDSDDESDASDVEEAEKAVKNKKQQVSYEAADDDDKEVMGREEETVEEDGEMEKEGEKGKDDEKMEIGVEAESMHVPRPSQQTASMDSSRIEAVVSQHSHLTEYIYDAKNERWCQFVLKFEISNDKLMMSYLIEKLSSKVVVWEVPDIKKGFLAESQIPGEEGLYRLKTEGVNMQELWKYSDLLDVRRAYTNNIHTIAGTFGIEAAAVAIIKEVSSVFNVYGISVNHRHLSLIADYMTFDGVYKSFNRFGMDSNSSPFQQMSFETTMKFLRSATVRGDIDTLRSPSACLVTGNVVHGGTGAFQCLQKLVL